MKKTSYMLLLLAGVVAISCNNNMGYKKTKSGLLYKMVVTGKDPVAKEGNILKLHYTQRINDSLLGSSYGRMPAYAKIGPVADNAYSPEEVFKFLRKGDSVLVVQLVDSMMKKLPPGSLPPFMKKGDKLVLGLTVEEVFTSDSLAMADGEKYRAVEDARRMEDMKKMQEKAEAEAKADLVGQTKEMESWLAGKNIQAQKTGLGTYVVVKDPGTGMAAEEGKFVSVKYTGKKLSDGQVFESNMDGSNPPYPVQIGRGGVIRGWDEGLRLFKKGGKGTLYIPGALAYGKNPRPGSPFKADEALIFDVEIVDVSDTPPQRQQGPMPH
jgi:FKBP-type peptidyl-prolyl cis-trans isomerase FkpA